MIEYIAGIVSGFFLTCFILMMETSSTHSLYTKAIQECEAHLPRDEHCKVIGIPISKD